MTTPHHIGGTSHRHKRNARFALNLFAHAKALALRAILAASILSMEQIPLFDDLPLDPNWPFQGLMPGGYEMICADPAWRFATWSDRGLKKSPQRHYSCMALDEIKALPVAALAAPDCCLFLWATWPMLPQAMEVMESWGFAFKTGGVWHKRTKYGKTAFGTGYRVRCASEPWLLGFRGNPKNSRALRNVIEGPVRAHSQKPDEAYRWMEAYLPDARRADLFSRENREGWTAWGDQAGLFNQGDSNVIGCRQSEPADLCPQSQGAGESPP
jgi:N6-adenosine-specific RNA methylase IME4